MELKENIKCLMDLQTIDLQVRKLDEVMAVNHRRVLGAKAGID